MLSETVECATVSPYPHTLQHIPVQCYLSLRQQSHCDFGDCNDGVGHVMKITTDVSNHDMGDFKTTNIFILFQLDFPARE